MKLPRRIRDLVRSGLRAPRSVSNWGRVGSSRRIEARLEWISKSLTRSVAREKHLRDGLALAEREGREKEANRLRRELAALTQSKDELQAALDLIEARIEMESSQESAAEPRPAAEESLAPPASLTDAGEDTGLADRKARLSAPGEEKQGPQVSKTR